MQMTKHLENGCENSVTLHNSWDIKYKQEYNITLNTV